LLSLALRPLVAPGSLNWILLRILCRFVLLLVDQFVVKVLQLHLLFL
jgi:hypothetical protein